MLREHPPTCKPCTNLATHRPTDQGSCCVNDNSVTPHGETPSKLLENISPVPILPQRNQSKRKQSATNITSDDFIATKRKKITERNKKGKALAHKNVAAKRNQIPKTRGKKPPKRRLFEDSVSEEDDDDISLHGSSSDELNFEENECVECLELYQETTSTSDWIQYVGCSRWLHESCTLYENMCCLCGRLKNKLEEQKSK